MELSVLPSILPFTIVVFFGSSGPRWVRTFDRFIHPFPARCKGRTSSRRHQRWRQCQRPEGVQKVTFFQHCPIPVEQVPNGLFRLHSISSVGSSTQDTADPWRRKSGASLFLLIAESIKNVSRDSLARFPGQIMIKKNFFSIGYFVNIQHLMKGPREKAAPSGCPVCR